LTEGEFVGAGFGKGGWSVGARGFKADEAEGGEVGAAAES
jgi:hypothetical protein